MRRMDQTATRWLPRDDTRTDRQEQCTAAATMSIEPERVRGTLSLCVCVWRATINDSWFAHTRLTCELVGLN